MRTDVKSSPGTPQRLARLAAVPAAILGWNILFFSQIWNGAGAFWFRDTVISFLPLRLYLRERLLSGEWPLWTQAVKAGMPFWADPVNGVLYPLHMVLVALDDPVHAYGLLVAGHYALAHGGFYVWLRGLGRSRTAAFMSALAVAYGGAFLQKHENLQFLYCWSWLGWYLATAGFFLKNPSWPRFALSAAVMWNLVTSGDIQTFYLASITGVALALLKTGGDAALRIRRAIQTGWAPVTAALLAAPWLLTVHELSGRTLRAAQNSFEFAAQWSFHPFRWIEWLAPGVFGFTFQEPGWWAGGIARSGWQGFYTPSSYFGVLLIPLAALGLWRGRGEFHVRFWAAAGVAGYLWSCGDYLPFYRILYDWLPFWSQFRFPERLLLWVMLGLAVLAARGLDELWQCGIPGLWLLPAVCVAVSGLLRLAGYSTLNLSPWINGIAGKAAGPEAYSTVTRTLESASAVWLAAAVTLLLAIRLRPPYAAVLLLLFTTAELYALNRPLAPVRDSAIYREKPALLARLEADFPALASETPVPARIFPNSESSLVRWEGSETADVSRQMWNLLYGNGVMATPYSTPTGYNSSELATMYRMIRSAHWRNYTALVDAPVWGILSGSARQTPGWKCGEVDSGTGMGWCSDGNRLGPVRCPTGWEVPPSPEALLDRYRRTRFASRPEFALLGSFDPHDPAPPAAAIPDPAGQSAPAATGSALPASRCEAVRWNEDAWTLAIERETAGPVILRDNYYPGWNAYLDGERLPVFTANGGQLAVWTPPGSHEIKLRFEPPLIDLGTTIAAITLVFNLGLWWWGRRENILL